MRINWRIVIWSCSKCGMTIQANNRPSLSGCPAGSSHHWLRTNA